MNETVSQNLEMDKFDAIRPYYDEEVPGVIENLLQDREFISLIGKFRLPRLTKIIPPLSYLLIRSYLRAQLKGISNIRGWQEVAAGYARRLIDTSMDHLAFANLEHLDLQVPHLFVSNHRDIAGDSMLVNFGLYTHGGNTVRIAVGDNLVQKKYATDIMRLNKSFFIQRSVSGVKNLLRALTLSSEYIHQSLREGESVWIAQREGRSKDGRDLTDPAIIKMFALALRKAAFGEVIKSLSIVPVAVSYEYDPCDLLKAREMSVRESSGRYEKPEGEDLLSLVTGLSGYKGRVVVSFGEPLSDDYESPEAVALEVDRQILSMYQLFPVNYYALSLLDADQYSEMGPRDDKGNLIKSEDKYLDERLQECPPDHRKWLIRMYANPVISKKQLQSRLLQP